MLSQSNTMYHHPIAVVGLGYGGLPLLLQFARWGAIALGFDPDSKVNPRNSGLTDIKHVTSRAIADEFNKKAFWASADFSLFEQMGQWRFS